MQKIRVLIAKLGLDGHDRGAKVVAQSLKNAGMEVVYTGLRQTPEQVVETAIQEDVQVIGISILSGAHMHLLPPLVELLKERGAGDMLVIVGGIIPKKDISYLKQVGVAEVFTPGAATADIIDMIKSRLG